MRLRPDRAPDGGVVGAVARRVVHHAEVPGPHLAGVELAQEGLDLEVARPEPLRPAQAADGGVDLLEVAVGEGRRQVGLQVFAGACHRLVHFADGGPHVAGHRQHAGHGDAHDSGPWLERQRLAVEADGLGRLPAHAVMLAQFELMEGGARRQLRRPLQVGEGGRGIPVAHGDMAAQPEVLGPPPAMGRQLVEQGAGLGEAVALVVLDRLLELAVDVVGRGRGGHAVTIVNRRQLEIAPIRHPPARSTLRIPPAPMTAVTPGPEFKRQQRKA
jgi:hypothetical protein